MSNESPPIVSATNTFAAWRKAVLLVAAVLSLGLLLVRGIGPGLSFGGDLTMIHAGAKLWWEGGNPYDFEALYAAYEQAGGQGERPKDVKWFVALYPPTTYAVLGPLGVLSWPTGRAVWLALSLVSVGAVAAWGWRWRPRGTPHASVWFGAALLLCVWFAYAPVHTTLRFGQLGLVVLALMLWGIGTPGRAPKPWITGLLFALAGAIKPQLAGVIALGLLPLGRWRDLLWTLGFGLVVTAVAVGRFELAGVPWLSDLLTNLERFAGKDFADPRPSNPVAHQMLNLDPLAWRLGMDTMAGRAAVWAVFGLSLVWAVWRIGRERCRKCGVDERQQPGAVTLWLTALLAVLTLLVAYHRFYDAVVLAPVAVWAWRRGLTRKPTVLATFALLLAFLFPVAALLSQLADKGVIPEVLIGLPGWHAVVMHHATWALLALWLTLLWAGPNPNSMGSATSSCPAPAPPGTAAPA